MSFPVVFFKSITHENINYNDLIPSKKWAECETRPAHLSMPITFGRESSVWGLHLGKTEKKRPTIRGARVFSHGKSGSTPNTTISWVTLTLPEVPNVAYENPHHFLVLVHTIKNGGFFHGYVVSLQECNITYLGGGFIFVDFHRYLGKSIQFDDFFQMCWNHHLDSD